MYILIMYILIMYILMYVYTYVLCLYIYVYTYVYVLCLYIYVCIQHVFIDVCTVCKNACKCVHIQIPEGE